MNTTISMSGAGGRLLVHKTITLKQVGRFITQWYCVMTDRCIDCGKIMDEQSSYGIRCMKCEG